MPKKIVTKQDTREVTSINTAENAMLALAEAIGSSVVKETNGDKTTFSVSFSSLGYPELEFKIIDVTNATGLYKFTVHFNNKTTTTSQIRVSRWNLVASDSCPFGNACTCYVAMDSNNDTVVIGMHPGRNETAEWTGADYDLWESYICMFVGKDVNNDVIWGFGHNHINEITDGTKVIMFPNNGAYTNNRFVNFVELGGPSGLFHFVKMRNYFSEGRPEMKTAYVSMVGNNMVDNIREARANITYYADGALFGYPGTNFKGESDYGGQGYYPPIDPYVKL